MSNKLASAEGERWLARQAGAEPTPYTQEDLLLIASAQHGGLGCISEGGAKRCQSMFVAAGFVSAFTGESLPTVESRFPPNGLVNGQDFQSFSYEMD